MPASRSIGRSNVQRALVDTGVLYAAFDRRDRHHDTGLAIVRAADARELPELVVPDFVLAETMNALTQRLSHEATLEAVDRLERSVGFTIERTTNPVWARGRSVYERRSQLSYVDAIIVAWAKEHGLEHCYSFDAGFDSVDGMTRLNTDVNPYEPE